MPVELTVPEVGESINEVVIGDWLKAEGDQVEEDESVAELESDKATVELPAPVAGKIVKLLKSKGDSAEVGEVIAVIEESGSSGQQDDGKRKHKEDKPEEKEAKTARTGKTGQKAAKKPERDSNGKTKTRKGVAAEGTEQHAADAGDGEPHARSRISGRKDSAPAAEPGPAGEVIVMPAAARELWERGLKPSDVSPSGPGNRLLKEDVLRHSGEPAPRRTEKEEPADETPKARVDVPDNSRVGERAEEVVAMTPMRKTIAERLVTSQQQGALLTTFNEVDMSRVVELRSRYKESFNERYGIKLGFMSFFVKAAVEALKQFPQVNAEIRGTDIVYKNYFDISIAVSGAKGLVVPVIRNAERKSFAEIELIVDDFAQRAQKNRIELDELKGGTFTISNGGVFGSLMSTPIINPPQVAVLGLHAIEDRPVVIDKEIVVRPMMYVALTYDHRIIDGRESVTFLKRIKETIEDPGRMLLEI